MVKQISKKSSKRAVQAKAKVTAKTATVVRSQAAKVKYAKTAKVSVLAKTNPHRSGKSATQWASWVKGKAYTVAAYLQSGGTMRRLNRLVGAGAVKVA